MPVNVKVFAFPVLNIRDFPCDDGNIERYAERDCYQQIGSLREWNQNLLPNLLFNNLYTVLPKSFNPETLKFTYDTS